MLMGSIITHITYCNTHSHNQQFFNFLQVSILENFIWPLLPSICLLDFKWIYRKTHFNTFIPTNILFYDTVCKWTIWKANFQLLFDHMNWNGSLQCLTQSASGLYVQEYSVVTSLLSSRRLWTFQGNFQWILCASFPCMNLSLTWI